MRLGEVAIGQVLAWRRGARMGDGDKGLKIKMRLFESSLILAYASICFPPRRSVRHRWP
jgi:hypothetical protein